MNVYQVNIPGITSFTGVRCDKVLVLAPTEDRALDKYKNSIKDMALYRSIVEELEIEMIAAEVPCSETDTKLIR